MRSVLGRLRGVLVALFAAQGALRAQGPMGDLYAPRGGAADTVAPALPHEFRAVWIATVDNIDWPSKPGLPVDVQKAELVQQLDLARRLHLNAVILQVRPTADALYPSKIEPWSYFLTGAMGRAPSPWYDPLAFAIEEAHARGLELHAWFNPYRSRHPADKSGKASPLHMSRKAPGVVSRYGEYQWMDPGSPTVRSQTMKVILDVVRRYDVDGVHLDDYFYPYPETRRGREIPFNDNATWRAYQRRGGALTRDDWRRKNVDDFVRDLYSAVKKEKSWVKVGISPFGIWRPGYPSMVRGFDAYTKLYADSRRWLGEGWVDYFVPQLYWKTSAPQQPFAELLSWWRGENALGRHVWPGLFTNRASAARPTWQVGEVFDQIRVSRDQLAQSSGNVHFSASAFAVNSDSLVERLEAGPYAEPALVPAFPWLAPSGLSAPIATVDSTPQGWQITISPQSRTRQVAPGPRWWLIRARFADGWRAQIVPTKVSRMVVGIATDGARADCVSITAIGATGGESVPILLVPAASGRAP